jgi:glycerophosphoryl diester phosphodiesterase
MWTDLTSPIVIAHRGDKTHAPENTLAAFMMAAENGADAIEFDTKLTADGQVIVIHDRTVDRTTNGTGKISKLPFAAIRNLDAGAWFSGAFRGERIPTLDEVFETVGRRLHINIELTNYATPGDDLVGKVVELILKHNLQEQILFSSFFPYNLKKVRSLLPKVPRGLLTMRGSKGFLGRALGWRGDYFALHPFFTDTTPELIKQVRATGKRVHVWTVNAEEDLKRMISLGVDAIITDDPKLTLHLLGRSGSSFRDDIIRSI